jgi:hypothetical protein
MTDEETTHMTNARDGSIETTVTISNESAPTPEKVGIWEQIQRQIDPASKVVSTLSSGLLVAWSLFLLAGGFFFLYYYWSIGFWPELDFKASVTVLAVSASTGTIVLLMLGISLLGPAKVWVS